MTKYFHSEKFLNKSETSYPDPDLREKNSDPHPWPVIENRIKPQPNAPE